MLKLYSLYLKLLRLRLLYKRITISHCRRKPSANRRFCASGTDGSPINFFANFSFISSGRTSPSKRLNIELLFINWAAVVGGRIIIPHLHKAVAVVRNLLHTQNNLKCQNIFVVRLFRYIFIGNQSL